MQPQNNEKWTNGKANRNFRRLFVCVILRGGAITVPFTIDVQCMPTRLFDGIFEIIGNSVLLGLFASLWRCKLTLQFEMWNEEYLFKNSIYGEHNLQKFTKCIYKMEHHSLVVQGVELFCLSTRSSGCCFCRCCCCPDVNRLSVEHWRCLVRWRCVLWALFAISQNGYVWNKFSVQCVVAFVRVVRRILWLLLKLM